MSIDLKKGSAELTGDHLMCYVDETASNADGLCGAGMLVTTAGVGSEVIKGALECLENDPDRNLPERSKLDNQTLENRCFHTSADSANAHSHLCRSIKSNVEGVFLCSLFDVDLERRQMKYAGLSDTDFQNSAWNLAADFAILGGKQVDVFVEARQGLGSMGDTWVEVFRRRRDWQQFELAEMPIPVAYPAMSCSTKPKYEPGLQATDFLLWAAAREIKGDNLWANRVGLNRTYAFRRGHKSLGGLYVYSLGEASFDLPLPKYDDEVVKLLGASLPEGMDERRTKYLGIEWFVCVCAKYQPDSAKHFAEEVAGCMELLSDRTRCCSADSIERLATMFLRLFDTVPAYAPELGLPQTDLRVLFAARETAALVIRKDQTASRRLVADMSRIRQSLLQNDPSQLPYIQLFGRVH